MATVLSHSDAMIYVSDPETDEVLFISDSIRRHFGIVGDVIGQPCYKIFQSGMDKRCDFCPRSKLDKEPHKPVVWEEYNSLTNNYYRNTDRYVELSNGKNIHIQYIVDLTDIKQAQKTLENTSAQLELALKAANAASKAKGDFLSAMSHEMRTPMNAIIGMVAIGKKAKAVEQKDAALNKIEDASIHLLGIINDVLDMAKIEADKLELAPAEYDFEKMLRRVMIVIGHRIGEKRLLLSLNADREIPRFIIGDEQRLAQVITNLVSNAIKFTPEEGKIRVDASLIGKTDDGNCELQIEVTDNGIGIDHYLQGKLFQAFEQAESGTTRSYGGSGLGLVISKRIVELMGGAIWVESTLGKGAKFTFTVKMEYSLKNTSTIGEQAGGGAGKAWSDQYIISNTDSSQQDILSGESGTGGEFTNKRMLLAEDIKINRDILITLLEDTGLIIDCAENGRNALDMIEADPSKYDIVLMDVQMPKMDGLEATRRIRALPALQNIRLPIVAMTANVFRDDIEACIAAGMNEHLGKPLDIDKVLKTLRKYLLREGA